MNRYDTERLVARRGQPWGGWFKEVSVGTVDEINTYPPPILLKIDVEGSELDALRGATATLRGTQMILAEASFMPRYSGDANLFDLLGFLADHGLDLVDLPAMEQDELVCCPTNHFA